MCCAINCGRNKIFRRLREATLSLKYADCSGIMQVSLSKWHYIGTSQLNSVSCIRVAAASSLGPSPALNFTYWESGIFSPDVKRPERADGNSIPSSSEINNRLRVARPVLCFNASITRSLRTVNSSSLSPRRLKYACCTRVKLTGDERRFSVK